MKKLTFLLVAFFAVAMVNAQTTTVSTPAAVTTPQPPKDITKVLEFKNDNYDFGKIPFGKPTEYTVQVKNISSEVVTLDNVQVGCGCTTPKYEKGAKINPNQTYDVVLGFNGGTDGAFTKVATLFFSGGLTKVVTFKGATFKPAETPAPANAATAPIKSN